MFYAIRIHGHLDGRWSEWFEGMTITVLDGGDSVLSGDVVDQAALVGLLIKLRDLGVPLLAVNPSTPDALIVCSECPHGDPARQRKTSTPPATAVDATVAADQPGRNP
jgi:hypothetical protein